MIRSVATLLALLFTSPVTTETVNVRGRGEVDLTPFACTDTPRSTVVQRVCYDEAQRRMLVDTGGTYFEYCRLPAATFDAFVVAPSMGQYYRRIAAAPAQFDCDTRNKKGRTTARPSIEALQISAYQALGPKKL